MGYIGLLLSGAALFLNSLVILGKAEMKSAGVFNLFVGALQIIIPFYLIMISDQSNWTVYSYAATFLFGLTYLYVGVTFIKGMDSSGLGWFCIWVAIIALFYMVVSFVQFHDVVNALTWFMWALLWYLFFVLNTQKKNINQYLGRIAFVQSWVTLTLPSLFYFMGVWGEGFVYELWVYVSVISILYFCYCIYKYRVR
ncbi:MULTISPECIES: AmiS/UreI family transporter [Bacillus]|uniref:Acetamide transporter n=6 Tax=Bacillus cereus group TaxID=86661 RepID=A0A9W7QWC5_BACCE|nr:MULTISPECIES: AmiS/UreI family transporter [Bacillus]PAW38492.1 acetamide transporter [Bacillus toyonensis]AEA19142.1 acetamide transporter [Bacillus thuringiensis serovar chinensis CT-43]AFV21298.1 putative transporter protein AmiS2 [Bacillus thuringiensis Bt407]AGG04291.1 AmiS_UreI, AmiS/UreI family transporter [Bacillus thuringiensis serovar thuringiensis str. IS5056]AHA75222.1 AmiS_UreI, AmiS/UreI family transporter [Bacillus thuringiensis YBT-1518]